ncbi:hypothetical protein [Streptomyces sp. NPDC003697]
MEQRLAPSVRRLAPALFLTGVSLALWAAWLGWDQQRDVRPDGSTTGPYEAWQVIGLVLSLLVPVYRVASRRHFASAVLGTTAGLTVAACADWSDDASGLFMVGVGMVATGSLAATAAVSALIISVGRDTRRIEP